MLCVRTAVTDDTLRARSSFFIIHYFYPFFFFSFSFKRFKNALIAFFSPFRSATVVESDLSISNVLSGYAHGTLRLFIRQVRLCAYRLRLTPETRTPSRHGTRVVSKISVDTDRSLARQHYAVCPCSTTRKSDAFSVIPIRKLDESFDRLKNMTLICYEYSFRRCLPNVCVFINIFLNTCIKM